MDGLTDGRMDGWMDGWSCGWPFEKEEQGVRSIHNTSASSKDSTDMDFGMKISFLKSKNNNKCF